MPARAPSHLSCPFPSPLPQEQNPRYPPPPIPFPSLAMASATAAAAACPWDALPVHLQERILSLLPITELLPVAAASRALRRLLRSPAFLALLSPHRFDAFFLLSPHLAVHPLSRRVLPTPPLAAISPPSYPLVSSACPSILITCASLHHLPPLPAGSYLLSVVVPPRSSSSYTLVAVTTGATVRSYTLDTADPSRRWASRGDLPLPFALLGNATVAGDGGQLYVLGRGPDALLLFDLATGQWVVLPVVMPHGLTTAHLFVLDGRLFLVGGVERFGEVERVVVWQMDGGEEDVWWREVGVMPADVLDELVAGRHSSFWHFLAADRLGIVCLYNAVDGRLVMFDAADGTWTVLPRVSGLDAEESLRWFGHVLEPGVELLLGQCCR
ncbi:protein ABERRANT PANICLE ORGANIZATION 1-like [Phragmites australis]|uniref:protein ABERRANT PANICLE ORGANIZATION 1-like n=1 Tax=Phragmites australis TaxID=29695 RepID=UPI002D78D74E|nr:protein ABERRANT PANICLE ORGANIZATION 1-like [Phragmites australis]XP_062211909.1 protein ABERRANT PANICLE ORGANIZATION 1-like [Phragmites australis]